MCGANPTRISINVKGNKMSDKCDSDVYENGSQVFLTHTIAAKDVEKWVQAVAKESGQKVDWHYCGGRAVVLALGDLSKVYDALKKLRPVHDALYVAADYKYLKDKESAQERADGIWQYNGLV
jgi:hypothetical protein